MLAEQHLKLIEDFRVAANELAAASELRSHCAHQANDARERLARAEEGVRHAEKRLIDAVAPFARQGVFPNVSQNVE